jgi:2,3-bisphosphoglycerate-dependent phosphoglycerate mutase
MTSTGDAAPTTHRQTRYARPAEATEFLLVRHGASEPFVEGQPFPLYDGHADPALDELGRVQAGQLVPRLMREHIYSVYVTTLRRTTETITPFLKASGREAEVIADLREVFLGEWEGGLLRSHFAAGHPAAKRMLDEGEWGHVPGAETTAQLRDRCVRSILALHARHPGQRIVCVVHGGVIGALCSWATGSPQSYHWGAENASVHSLVVHGDNVRLHLFNDTSHLD